MEQFTSVEYAFRSAVHNHIYRDEEPFGNQLSETPTKPP